MKIPLSVWIGKLWILISLQARLETKAIFDFWSRYFWIFFLCILYRFFFRAALWNEHISFDGFEIDFPLFIVSGLVFLRMINFSTTLFDEAVSNLKNSGVIDWILVTPTSIWEFFLAKALWKTFVNITELVVLIGFSNALIGTPLKPFLQGSILTAMSLMVLAYAGIGTGIAGLALVLRRGSFLSPVIVQFSTIFGGVFFPTSLLPTKINFLAHLLPITNALEISRYALIHAPQPNLTSLFSLLAGMVLGFWIVGFILLQRGLALAKKNGLLSKDIL